jgi:hypothetical protein
MPIDLDDLHEDFDEDNAESYNDHAHSKQSLETSNSNTTQEEGGSNNEDLSIKLAKMSQREREILRSRNRPSEDTDSKWDEFKI